MKKLRIFHFLLALVFAAALTGMAAADWLYSPACILEDALYQDSNATDGEIVVIGIDRAALEELGPLPWSRSVYAQAIETLNADPETAPAAIGIDVLFVEDSSDPEADALLVKAASYGNVIFPSSGTFGSELSVSDGNFTMDTRALLAWDSPFDDLLTVAGTGHINAMADTDGVIRHGMGGIDVPGLGTVSSFSRMLYEKWCSYNDLEPQGTQGKADGFFYIPFTTGPGGYYDSVSIADLLRGDVDPDYYAGKIVLIGPYASGLTDEYTTSISHAETMYGVEIQANIIDALRSGFFPTEADNNLQLALLFVICLGVFLWLRGRKVLPSVLIWLGGSIGWILICLIAYRCGIVLHVLYVPLALTVLFIISVASNLVAAREEKKQITGTFGRYVDPAVLKELLREGSGAQDLGGATRDIAVLFVDIRGFTAICEGMPPHTVVDILNRYLALTTDCILRNHGTLDKFMGDCTMAFWNAPVSSDDPIYDACRAAMDMVAGAKELGEELEKEFGRAVSFGVGVHYGPAVVGNIGSSLRMDYTAIGDTVNTASRLESSAPAGKIYISRAVADGLGDRAATTSLGTAIKLKGKADGFEILTLDSLQGKENEK